MKKLLSNPILLIILFLKVGITFVIIYCFYWLGLKGILGVVIGMSIMVVILFTNNPIALMFIRIFSGKMSLYKILKGEMDEEKEEYIEVGR